MPDSERQNQFNEQDQSVDELIRSIRQELGEPEDAYTPDQEEQTQHTTVDDFQADFGHAFDDYGEYVQEQTELPQPAKGHLKRIRFPVAVRVILVVAVLVLAGALLAKVGWIMADDVLALTRPNEDVEIEIDADDDLDSITAKLVDAGAVRYDWLFKFYCRFTGSENYFDPGVYTINLTYDFHALVNNLMATAATRETATIMIVEGASCGDIFTTLDENGVCSREDLEQAAANYQFDYDFLSGISYGSANRLEGFLFPDTYEFYLKEEPENVLDKFLRNFANKMDEEILSAVEDSGYTLQEVITLASMVEAEAADDTERPLIASVMFNRLNDWDNPLLNMDSTVFYAANLEGTSFDVNLDSPYNTYLYPGLPVGPINNPGLNSIRAVLNPESTKYYYFATDTDGKNRFFTSESAFTEFINSEEFAGYSSREE